ncbi:signal peptidase I [Streptomyces sp. NRRL F-5123]|uniref:signal peptidase I n=1 Tax=Streptomyces sp. NRRL F-5123 TaxID=1463856 RepID=UPI000693BC58|nr:signal peptidase I [Streptomyces sp. NRRL F-5123]
MTGTGPTPTGPRPAAPYQGQGGTWQPYPARLVRTRGSRRMLAVWVALLIAGAGTSAVGFALFGTQDSGHRVLRQSGVSMAPTYPAGSTVEFDRADGSTVRDGDVILFDGADWGSPGVPHMARLIARGGDHLAVSADGTVTLNGKALEEPYLGPDPLAPGRAADLDVPAGKLFVMGDNRNDSADSRFRGLVAGSRVEGVAVKGASHPRRHGAIALAGLAAGVAGLVGLALNATRAKRRRALLPAAPPQPRG